MSEYDCVHGYDISKYKCPKCEAGIYLTDEEIKQVLVSSIEEQSRQPFRDIWQVFARAILRKAQEK